MKFDEILEKLGQFGIYQKRVFSFLAFPVVSIGSFCFMVIVVLYTPDHRCKIPGLDNDTYEVQGTFHEELLNETIPLSDDPTLTYDQCNVYDTGSAAFDGNNRPINASLLKCTEWVYDKSVFSETFTSKANFVCGDALKTSHIQMFFYFGVLVGDFVLGMFADIMGRKKALCGALTLLLVASASVTWAPEFYSFAVIFVIGAFAHGAYVCIYVFSMEIVGVRKRVWTGTFVQIFFAVGAIYLATVSYLARDWIWINAACSIPCIFYLALWWFIPESPRWLISKGRRRESAAIIRKVADTNKVTLSESMLEVKEDDKGTHGNLWHVVKSPVLLKRTLILCLDWMIVSMTYYGVTMNAGNLGGSFYLNFLLMDVAELPGYLVGILLLDRIGRRWCNAGGMLVCGVACIATVPTVLLTKADLQWLTITLAFIGKAGASMAFAVVFIFTSELLPTVVRNAAIGSCSCAARVGAMLAPYIAKSGELIGGEFGQVEPLVVFGGLSVLSGLLLLLLPETLNQKLPDTIQEGEELGRKPNPPFDMELEVQAPFIAKDKGSKPTCNGE
ncbi:organic cation transporter protein-like [Mercenaria mercenaria]|uniref:organic cation transporter protein-like n=1 Tax=Mercenaria mercenaria TaxID=6596 RepID=UPI00234E5A36|nr:organic cation transporter protein-like [Mercenaria mercenaria]